MATLNALMETIQPLCFTEVESKEVGFVMLRQVKDGLILLMTPEQLSIH